jgi:TonB family protein
MASEVLVMSTIRCTAAVAFLLAAGCGSPSPPPPAAPPVLSEGSAPPFAPAPVPRSNPDTDAIEAARPALRACYERARTANGALGRTTVTLSLRVDEGGHVSTVDIEYKHKFDEAAKGCMRDAAFAIKLPPGASRRVTAPMTFEPK